MKIKSNVIAGQDFDIWLPPINPPPSWEEPVLIEMELEVDF